MSAAEGRGPGESRLHFRSAHKQSWPAEVERCDHTAPRSRVEALGTSVGGTFVVSDDPPPIGTDLHVWLYPQVQTTRIPRKLRMLARVRWINETSGRLPRGFGVAFRATTAEGEIALHGYFSRLTKVV